jgi:hypothetical protein
VVAYILMLSPSFLLMIIYLQVSGFGEGTRNPHLLLCIEKYHLILSTFFRCFKLHCKDLTKTKYINNICPYADSTSKNSNMT